MKVLLLNTYLNMGGAARATHRIYQGLSQLGANVHLLTQDGLFSSAQACSASTQKRTLLNRAKSKLKRKLDHLGLSAYRERQLTPFSAGSAPDLLGSQVRNLNPDVIHLNWISDGFMKIESLSRFGKPLLWTLHDCWAYTGGCHYTFGCNHFSQKCGQCPQLKSNQDQDLSRRIWTRKFENWEALNITLVAPSRWMASEAQKSSLFKNRAIEVIPNGLDIETFKPIDKKSARAQLGLPQEKQLILFGALDATTDPRKGYDHLEKALRILSDDSTFTSEVELVIFGNSNNRLPESQKLKMISLGRVSDDHKLALIYSACDIMVVPSTEESFGQTASESLACGTPVVAFSTTGLIDIVDHLMNGYLAQPFDCTDMAQGIRSLLKDKARLTELSGAAREKALESFALPRVAQSYLKLYQRIAYPTPG